MYGVGEEGVIAKLSSRFQVSFIINISPSHPTTHRDNYPWAPSIPEADIWDGGFFSTKLGKLAN